MLTENDNLKEEVQSLRMSISERTRTETDNRLQTELLQVTKERDEALKNLLLTR